MKSIIATLALLGSIASTTQASSWAKFESKWMENNFMRWHYSFGGDALSSWGQVFLEAIRKEEADQAVGVGFGGNGQPSGENWQAYQINGVWYFDISEEAHHYNTDKHQSFVVKGVHDVTGENCCEQGIFDDEYCNRTGVFNCH
jgi:hypothetical protein